VADVALVLIDAAGGIVARISRCRHRAQGRLRDVIVLSKWDITSRSISKACAQLQRGCGRARTSSGSREERQRLEPERPVELLFERYTKRIRARVNRAVDELRARRERRSGTAGAQFFSSRASTAPPRFDLRERSVLVKRDYGSMGRERVRERFELEGRAGVDRLRQADVKFLVRPAGSWGTAFTTSLLRWHESC